MAVSYQHLAPPGQEVRLQSFHLMLNEGLQYSGLLGRRGMAPAEPNVGRAESFSFWGSSGGAKCGIRVDIPLLRSFEKRKMVWFLITFCPSGRRHGHKKIRDVSCSAFLIEWEFYQYFGPLGRRGMLQRSQMLVETIVSAPESLSRRMSGSVMLAERKSVNCCSSSSEPAPYTARRGA